MGEIVYTLTAVDGTLLQGRLWTPEDRPRGVLQVCHGMAEHSGRYRAFAEYLVQAGWAVGAMDHRGHGKTAPNKEALGFFGENNGWSKVVEDCARVGKDLQSRFPEVPLFLLGHSMGSFLARNLAATYPGAYKGFIFSGTAGNPGPAAKIGRWVALREVRKKGSRNRSKTLDTMMFGSYNKKFRPNRTGFDWISSVPDEVDEYINDPFCGFVCTSRFYADLLDGVLLVNASKSFEVMDPERPVFFFSGNDDPVGGFGNGVTQVYDRVKAAGVKDVSVKLYPGGRHEMFHEKEKELVFSDVLEWLEARSSS
ncbi:MAG: alpha/beta hydrolase [Spirochaetales bacterium]|nr:alpha/beta hydrolase [Spirochaetales bacterium]